MDPLVAMAIIAGSILFLGLLILLLLKIALMVYERMEYKQFLKDQKLMQYQVSKSRKIVINSPKIHRISSEISYNSRVTIRSTKNRRRLTEQTISFTVEQR